MIKELLAFVIAIGVAMLALPLIGAVLAIITLGEFHDAE